MYSLEFIYGNNVYSMTEKLILIEGSYFCWNKIDIEDNFFILKSVKNKYISVNPLINYNTDYIELDVLNRHSIKFREELLDEKYVCICGMYGYNEYILNYENDKLTLIDPSLFDNIHMFYLQKQSELDEMNINFNNLNL